MGCQTARELAQVDVTLAVGMGGRNCWRRVSGVWRGFTRAEASPTPHLEESTTIPFVVELQHDLIGCEHRLGRCAMW
jgi:hypothetical protein